jgi:hypothetical protein
VADVRTDCTRTDTRDFNVKFYGHEDCELCGMTKIMCLPKYNFRLGGFVEWNLEESLVSQRLLLLLLLLLSTYF